jgi:hypothetical protein
MPSPFNTLAIAAPRALAWLSLLAVSVTVACAMNAAAAALGTTGDDSCRSGVGSMHYVGLNSWDSC